MTTEVEVNEQEQVQVDAHDEAAFAAGFAEARGDEPPAEAVQEPEQQQVAEQQTETQPEPAAEPQAPSEVEVLRSMVESLKGETEQRTRQIFGKMGELNSLIQQHQTAKGGVTQEDIDEAFAEFREEFPEMATMFNAGLQKVLSKVGGPQGQPADFDKLVEERVASRTLSIEQNLEKRLLTRDHPDWQTVVVDSEFGVWKSTLPAEEQSELNSSWNADVIGGYLTRFKSHRAERLAAETKARENKQQRLAEAVAPRGQGAPAPQTIDDEAAFAAGFKAVRGLAA